MSRLGRSACMYNVCGVRDKRLKHVIERIFHVMQTYRSIALLLYGIIFFPVLTGVAQEQTTQDAQSEQTEETIRENEALLPIAESEIEQTIRPIGVWDTVRVFVVLAFVVGGIYLFVWGLKKINRKGVRNIGNIDLLASRSLAGGGIIHLMKVGRSVYLIGASPQKIVLLKEINNKEEIDELQLEYSFSSGSKTSAKSFEGQMKTATKRSSVEKRDEKNVSKQGESWYAGTKDVLNSFFRKPVVRE